MNIVYKQYTFPTQHTTLERVVDQLLFRITPSSNDIQLFISFENELMLLEFSKSLKATISALNDNEKISYITTNILLEPFVAHFNALYHLKLKIECF